MNQQLPKWIETLSESLLNPKYPQISGELVLLKQSSRYESTEDITPSDIEGKCALGEIACHVGISVKEILDSHTYLLKSNDQLYKEIMFRLGVPKDLIIERILPEIVFDKDYEIVGDVNGDYKMNIDEYIYSANDSKWSYPQIVEFIETTFGECFT